MTPTDPRLLVHAYVDGELDPAHALEVERQLADDPALAVERERVEALRRVIAEQLPREGAPPGLAQRIEAAIGLRPAPAPARASSRPSWRALAASVAVAAFLGSGANLTGVNASSLGGVASTSFVRNDVTNTGTGTVTFTSSAVSATPPTIGAPPPTVTWPT